MGLQRTLGRIGREIKINNGVSNAKHGETKRVVKGTIAISISSKYTELGYKHENVDTELGY